MGQRFPIFATPPEFQTVPTHFTWVDDNATTQCGFPVQFDVVATVKMSVHDLHNGTVIEIDRYVHATTTFTNLNTYSSYTSHNAGPTKFIFQPDGTFSFMVMGTVAHIRAPGAGLLIKDAGRYVVDQDGNIVFQAGDHPIALGGNVQGLCTALS